MWRELISGSSLLRSEDLSDGEAWAIERVRQITQNGTGRTGAWLLGN